MLDIKYIRENADAVKENAKNRYVDVDIDRLLELDTQRREVQQKADELRTERNTVAEKLKETKGADKTLVERGKELKEELAAVEESGQAVEAEYTDLMLQVPNLTHPEAPLGKDDSENIEISRFLEPTEFDFEPKDHVALGEELHLIDFERGAEVAGSGFYYLKNEAAMLDLALTNYAMQMCIANGFEPMITPDIARESVLSGTGFNPRGESTQIYNIDGTDLSLIATAEITVAGYYQNHIFEQGELDEPKKIVALSHCFRTEAGSYGRTSKGLYRVHQFTKVEMFVYCKPEDSERMHEELREMEEKIMQGLGLPYRVVNICTGDLGGPAYRKYDLEAWMPFKQDWGEITSTSNCTDYQSRRLKIRYKDENGNNQLAHTLNGTAMVMSRIPLAILENFQNADGSVDIPEALHPYMFGVTKILPSAK